MTPTLHRISTRGKRTSNTGTANLNGSERVAEKDPRKKRVRDTEDTVVESESVPAKKAKVVIKSGIQPGVRRSGRSPKPNGKAITQKRKRRTKAEVEAAKATAETAKMQKEKTAQDAKQRLAQMDDVDKAQTAANTIRRLSDMAMNSATDLDGEEFVGFNDVSSTSDESDDDEDLKENYRVLQKQLKELQQKIGSGRRSGTKKVEGGKKRPAPKKDVAYASGLIPDWNVYAKDGSKKSLRHVNIGNGGINDDDAEATNPYSTPKDNHPKAARRVLEAGKRDLSRRNELVTIASPNAETKPIKRNVRSSKPSERKGASKAIEVKSESEENVPDDNGGKLKKRRVIHTNNVRVNDLPHFAKDQTWKKTFLPTLYDKFFTSSNPFSQFTKGSNEFISLLQLIVREVYPNVRYKVSASDPIHALAYNRVNEKRSNVGLSAINIVKKHINTLEGEAIRNWLIWASRGDGPLFFKDPVLPDAPLDREDPNYVKPGGKLLTGFIIDLVTPFLRLNSGSASRNGHPRGLIALAMAALERAVTLLLQPSDEVPDFSNGSWGSKVAKYYQTLENVNEHRWKDLLAACGGSAGVVVTVKDLDENYQANLSFLDHNRAALFDFSSPIKA